MANIKFSQESHYITKDNVAPADLDESSLRSFLRASVEIYERVERLIRTHSDYRGNKALLLLKKHAEFCRQAISNNLPHLKGIALFYGAEEAESMLRYLTSSLREQINKCPEAFKPCSLQCVQNIEEAVTEQCKCLLEQAGTPVAR